MRTKGIIYVPTSGEDVHSVARVADVPLVGLIIDALRADGVTEVAVLAANHALAQIRASVQVDGPPTPEATFIGVADRAGLLDALAAAAEFVGDDPALLHFATGLLGQSAAPILDSMRAGAPDLTLLLHRGRHAHNPLDAATERLLGVAELGSPGSHLSIADIAVFGPGAIRRATSGSAPVTAGASPGDVTPQRALVGLADGLAERELSVAAGLVAEWCEYAPTPAAMLELNRCVLDRQGAGPGPIADDAGSRIEGRVIIHPTANVSSSVILGPSRIGAQAVICDAYIGPYTSIGAGAVIESAEVVRSIVGEGARIAHLSGRIEGSTIGPGAHIFRDFALPRALRLHVGENVEVSLD